MIVAADTGPVNYLILSGQIAPARALYGTLLLSPAVHRELLHLTGAASLQDFRWTKVGFCVDSNRDDRIT
jgi:hypothetical protein